MRQDIKDLGTGRMTRAICGSKASEPRESETHSDGLAPVGSTIALTPSAIDEAFAAYEKRTMESDSKGQEETSRKQSKRTESAKRKVDADPQTLILTIREQLETLDEQRSRLADLLSSIEEIPGSSSGRNA